MTAGLMWPPLMCPITQTIVATLMPNASEMRTTSPPSHDPQPTITSSHVPTSSATSDTQKLDVRISCSARIAILNDDDDDDDDDSQAPRSLSRRAVARSDAS